MPRRSAAWMTVLPSSTSTFWPSISTVGMRSRLLPGRPQRTAPEGGVLLELGAILRDQGTHRHGRRVGERADGVPHHVTRDVEEEVDVRRLGTAVLETDEDLLQPPRAFAARRALSARLVMEEALEDEQRPHHAHGVVHDHDAGGAEE